MKNLLLVDDNDKYAAILTKYFEKLGYTIERAVDGKDGFTKFSAKAPTYFNVICTDITMETQLAGVSFLSKVKKSQYKGTVVVASTGFDVPLGMPLSKFFLSFYAVDFLVPKTTVLSGNLQFVPISGKSGDDRSFKEVMR